ncbi:MAG: hypothetical protein M3Y33_07425 [Actinomycetota bacterium]|nr:hypothetical protein [Actinomycetota bacterium]
MSEQYVHKPSGHGPTLERGRDDVVDSAKPLPPDEDAVVDDLSVDEDRLFLAAILDAVSDGPRDPVVVSCGR